MLSSYTQVRSQLLELCDQRRFSTARLYLAGAGYDPAKNPTLWEFLARDCKQNGSEKLAHQIRQEIWAAGVRLGELAIVEVDYLTARDELEEAEFILTSAFGFDSHLPEVKRRLGQIYLRKSVLEMKGERIRFDKQAVIDLAADFALETPNDVKMIVDLLRNSEEFAKAKEVNDRGQEMFPNDLFLRTRNARILEMLNDLKGAAQVWEELSLEGERFLGTALLRLEILYTRLERAEDVARIRAQLVLAKITPLERLRFALQAGQIGMAYALAEHIGLDGTAAKDLSRSDQQQFCDALLDHGEIGLVVWLRRRRLTLSTRARNLLDNLGFAVGGARDMPDDVAEAREIRSPNFLLPIERTLKMSDKPAGWPGVGKEPERILLVNSTLGIGGAERQFVELVRALIERGIPKERIDVAIFSLAADRGHAHFLPALEALGVDIIDLSDESRPSAPIPNDINVFLQALPARLRADCTALVKLVNQLNPHVLHGWQDRSAAASGVIGTIQSVERVVMSFRNMSPITRRIGSLAENQALFQAFAERENFVFTANSSRAAKDYDNWLGSEESRVLTIYNALDTGALPDLVIPTGGAAMPIPKPGQKLRIGGVFRMAINKRPLLWLRTLARLRDVYKLEFTPVLFGSGPLMSEVEAEAERLGLHDLVIHQEVIDLTEIYESFDVLMLMSSVEGLPNVLLEAQAMGKPVVTCDVGGSAEAVKSGGKGAGLVSPMDVEPDAAAAQINDWLQSLTDVPPMLLRRFVEEKFSREKLGRETYLTYLGLPLGVDHVS